MQKLPIISLPLGAVVVLLVCSGCALTGRQLAIRRGNRDDPQASQDQSDSLRTDRRQPRVQQPWDAPDGSGQEGKSGVYVGGGSTASPHWPVATGSLGVFKLPTAWSTVRGGVFGLDNDGIGVAGAEAGIRLHAPTRLTPYVGLSGDVGFSGLHSGYVNNRSHRSNPNYPTGTVSKASGLVAAVPEVGVSYWLNSSTRLNAGASYYFALDQSSFLLFGTSLEFVLDDGFSFNLNDPWTKSSNVPHLTREAPDAMIPSAPPSRIDFDERSKSKNYLAPVPMPDDVPEEPTNTPGTISGAHFQSSDLQPLSPELSPILSQSSLFSPESLSTPDEWRESL